MQLGALCCQAVLRCIRPLLPYRMQEIYATSYLTDTWAWG